MGKEHDVWAFAVALVLLVRDCPFAFKAEARPRSWAASVKGVRPRCALPSLSCLTP